MENKRYLNLNSHDNFYIDTFNMNKFTSAKSSIIKNKQRLLYSGILLWHIKNKDVICFSDIFPRSLPKYIFDPDLGKEVEILENTNNIFEYNLPY